MRCPNPDCDGDLRPGDRHCPLCGTAVDEAAPVQPAVAPPLVPAATPRVSQQAVPRRAISREGEAYPALRSLSAVLIKTGSALRWVFIGAGVVLLFLHVMRGLNAGGLGTELLLGAAGLGVCAIVGWLLWLALAVHAELLYLLLDVANVFISSQSSHRRQ